MDVEQIEKGTKLIQQASKILDQYTQVSLIVNMYLQGAPAESCMKRIQDIVLNGLNEDV